MPIRSPSIKAAMDECADERTFELKTNYQMAKKEKRENKTLETMCKSTIHIKNNSNEVAAKKKIEAKTQ